MHHLSKAKRNSLAEVDVKDPDECKVYCEECNGYLWSIAAVENHGQDSKLITCPYQRDPVGECTGRPKTR